MPHKKNKIKKKYYNKGSFNNSVENKLEGMVEC